MMIDVESYRQYAADCVRQAESEAEPEDKNILLNVALAWVRLAHQVQEVGTGEKPDQAIESGGDEAGAKRIGADDAPAIQTDQSDSELDKVLTTH